MKCKNTRTNFGGLLCITILLVLLSATGCSLKSVAGSKILTSKEQVWIIPRGNSFPALINKEIKQVTPDDDMLVIYKGSWAELQESADKRALKVAKTEKTKRKIWSVVASILSIGATLALKMGKDWFTKKAKKKKRKKK